MGRMSLHRINKPRAVPPPPIGSFVRFENHDGKNIRIFEGIVSRIIPPQQHLSTKEMALYSRVPYEALSDEQIEKMRVSLVDRVVISNTKYSSFLIVPQSRFIHIKKGAMLKNIDWFEGMYVERLGASKFTLATVEHIHPNGTVEFDYLEENSFRGYYTHTELSRPFWLQTKDKLALKKDPSKKVWVGGIEYHKEDDKYYVILNSGKSANKVAQYPVNQIQEHFYLI